MLTLLICVLWSTVGDEAVFYLIIFFKIGCVSSLRVEM